jgi:hypothetical protein
MGHWRDDVRRRQTAQTGAAPAAFTRIGPVPPLGFIGRTREVVEVLDALRQERVVSLVGVVGIGKSELGREIGRRSGRRVAEVGCRRDDTADAVRGRIERRLDALPGGLSASLAGALLILDDVHLLGTAADPLIDELARAAAPGGMVLILSEEHIPLRQGGREMVLGPLAIDDARALWTRLEELFGPTPHAAVDAAVARTRVPLALRREYAQAVKAAGKGWDLASLPREERRVLASVAICQLAGRSLLARLGDDETVDEALRGLLRRQAISVVPDGRFLAHDVTRAAVLGALDVDERRKLEAAAAAALLDDGETPDRIDRILDAARHLIAGERFAEAAAVVDRHEPFILARGGAGEALALVEQVARRWSDQALTSLHVRVLLRCGRVAAAREIFEPASATANPTLQLLGAEIAFAAGELNQALARLEPLASTADPGVRAAAAALAARIEVERGRQPARGRDAADVLVAQGRLDAAEATLGDAERAARADDAILSADEIARRRARIIATAGRLADAQERLAGLAAQARQRGAQLAALRAEVDLASVLVQRGRATAASAVAAAIAEEADARGLSLLAAEAELVVAAAELEAGRPAAAAQAAASLARAPSETVRQAARRLAARAAAWLGEPHAKHVVRSLEDQLVAAEIALAGGQGDAALELYIAAAGRAERAGRQAELAAALAEAARLHHTRGDRQAAAAAVARALSEGSAGGADRTVARALLVGAALAREDGNLNQARSGLTDALTVARAAGLAVERYAAARGAETLARLAGDAESGDMLAAVGRAAAATLGEHALAAADRLLADLGLAGGCAYRLTTADGNVSYASQMDSARLGLDRRDLVVDGAAESVMRAGKRVADLRRRTLLKRLLFLFAAAPGRLFTKEEIVERIWGVEYHPLHHDAALFTNVMRLRRLLGENGADLLRVAEGGYLLAPPRDFLFVERLPG